MTLVGRGWAWPEAYGGRDVGLVEWLIFEEEYYRSGAPGRVNTNGISLLGPTLYAFGNPKSSGTVSCPAWPPVRRSGPRAGPSPIREATWPPFPTKAVRDGEWFVLDGQKTWCSVAHGPTGFLHRADRA
ncbi:MAG: hypothetical protein Ct9H300mP12_06360 [Acidimicrobiales bacterium]|nr:MAG: hypothetical protein Ct9H300mP12_06360 [Acidimicrobiales bacterium]